MPFAIVRPGTRHVLDLGKLEFSQDVHLCQADYKGKDGLPVGKVMRFRSSHKGFCLSLRGRFGKCSCEKHSPLDPAGDLDGYWVLQQKAC